MEQRFYFNHRLQKAIDKIIDYPLTIVSAPLAFGKRIAIEEATRQAKEQGVNVEWFVLDEGEDSSYIYAVIEKLNTKRDGEWLYIFDGCEGEEWLEQLQIMRWSQTWQKGVHCVCIMASEIPMNIIHLRSWIHSISKEDLELKEKDILHLYQLHGIKITYQSAKMLYEYSGGWPGAIMLGIREYFYQNKLAPSAGIDDLLEQEFFKRYNAVEREAFSSIYGFKELTVEQILILTGVKQQEQDKILSLMEQNPFINYDIIQEKYIVEDVLFHYLCRRIKKASWLIQKRVELRRARWYESQGQFQESITIYQGLNEYELICQYPYKLSELCACTDRRFLDQLWNIWKQIPYHLKCKHVRFLMLSASLFFLWKENRKGNLILEEVEEIVDQVLALSGRKREEIQGELCLIRGMKYDRDLGSLQDRYQVALELLKGPSMLYDNQFILTEGIPCLLHKYYLVPGTLDQLVTNGKKCMDKFYELTQYSNAGSSYMIEAEAKFLRGQLEEARKLVYRGIQMAEEYFELLEEEVKKMEQTKFRWEGELCLAQFHTLVGNTSKIPNWICHDHSGEGEHSELVNTYLNYCYLNQLLLRKEEEIIIDIGQYLFEQAYESKFLWVAIQMKLIGAVAYHRVGNEKKAMEWLRTVLDFTAPDQIYMPIMRYYIELIPLFQKLIHEDEYQTSVQQVMELYQRLEHMRRGNKSEEKVGDHLYGLTKRELEIALLGAKRYRNNEIAKRLYISENTVKYNMKHIFQKLNIKSRIELKEFFE